MGGKDMIHLEKEDIVIGYMDGYCPYNILIEPLGRLDEEADRLQKADGKLPCFDDNGEYDDQDWYDFFFETNENGVSSLYFERGISGEYGDEIEIDEETKRNAFEVILDYYGGLEGYKEAIEEYEGRC